MVPCLAGYVEFQFVEVDSATPQFRQRSTCSACATPTASGGSSRGWRVRGPRGLVPALATAPTGLGEARVHVVIEWGPQTGTQEHALKFSRPLDLPRPLATFLPGA